MKSFENSPISASIRCPVRNRIVRTLPWLVLVLCLAITYGLWRDSQRDADHVQRVEFDSHVKDIHAFIVQRLAAYEQVLRGAAGLFAASAMVSREEFGAYVTALRLREHYPGIQGVGFSLLVPAKDKARHIAALRKQGFPDYAIRPEGERDSYTSIIYLEPFADRNLRAFGYDMFSEPVRRAAMERARDTGAAAVSGKVRLVQENDSNVQAGFLMYLPVYRNGAPHATVADRRANLLGWVYEPFRMDDLMLGIFGQHTEHLDVEVYDGERLAPETLMYDSDRHRVLDPGRTSAHASVRTLDIGGNRWTVAVHSRLAFEAQKDRGKPRLVAVAGSALSAMIGVLIWVLTQGQAQAFRLAEAMNRELIKSEARFHSLFTDSKVAMLLIDPADGRIVDANRAACAYYGYSYERLLAMRIGDINMLSPGEVAEAMAQALSSRHEHFLFRHRLASGEVRDVEVHSGLVSVSGQTLLYSIVHDITDRTRAEERLRQSHDLLQNLSAQIPGLIYQYQLFPDGRSCFPYASAAINEIYEVTPEQVREDAAPVLNLLHPDDNEDVFAAVWESARRLEPWRCEYRVVLPRQGLRWRRGDARPQRLADGSVLWHGFVTDITERKRAEAQEQARNRMFELLAGGGALPEILVQAVNYLEVANDRLSCMILMADESGRRLRVGAAPSLPAFYVEAIDGLAIGEGVASSGTAVFRDAFVAVEDIRSHPDWAPFRDLAAQAGLISCWSEPIRSSKGAVLGAFAVYQKQSGAPGARDLELIRQAARLAGIAIERKHIEAELLLASSVYQASGEAIMVTDAANLIVAVNPAFTRLTGYALPEVAGRSSILLGAGGQGDTFYQTMWNALATAGHWQGEVWDRRKNGEAFAAWVTINAIPGKDGEVYRYVALLSDITEKKRSDEIIWEHANYDPLTHLPNRRLFRDRLQQELKKTQRAGLSLALLFIDLDRFKEVNDTLGHNIGDLLLVEAARRIRGCVRDSDTVARLGGDEFTVILPQLNDAAHVEQVAEAVVRTLGQPFRLGEEMAYVSASVGITMYPADAVEVEDLLKNADQAMYVAKNQGRNGFSYFTASMQEAARERLRLINDLRGALAGDQFRLYFQPIVDLRTGRIAKAEALLRWHHPGRGMVKPAHFIPLAEEIGLIRDIGDWVFREATRWMRYWHGQRRAIQVSVNKSPVQFVAGHCYDAWKSHLQDIGLPGEFLVIEITEGFLLGDRPEIAQELEKFHDLGMSVAIDDFGTGYSSLSYLKRLDIDYLKIDRAFIRDMDSDPDALALSEAIIVMAHRLGLQVIAEGVETAKQRDLLAAAGCDYGQGYLFAEPMPAGEFDALLDRDAGRSGSKALIPVKISA